MNGGNAMTTLQRIILLGMLFADVLLAIASGLVGWVYGQWRRLGRH